MVSPTGCADGCKAIYHINRYLVCRLHICRLAGYPLNRFFVSCAIMSMRHTFDDGNVLIDMSNSAVVFGHLADACQSIPCVFEVWCYFQVQSHVSKGNVRNFQKLKYLIKYYITRTFLLKNSFFMFLLHFRCCTLLFI